MAETTEKQRSRALSYLLTPLLLLILCAGILVLCYALMPSHKLEKYLNIAFMDTQRTPSATAGLHIVEKDIPTEPENGQTYEQGEVTYPKFGEQFATLRCEPIDPYVGVYFGTNSELLSRGACMSTQSAVPGTGGNTVIDAHVNTFFADLSKMQVGDEVTVYTSYGKFVYEAEEAIRFEKTNKKYLQVTNDDVLTLYTCAPQVIGSSNTRVGMRCRLVSQEFYNAAE